MIPIPAGKRNTLLGLQRLVTTVDANGIRNQAWYTYATAWGRVIARSGRETERQGTFGETAGSEIVMPYYPGVSSLDRINANGRIFLIQSVSNVDEANRELSLSVMEET